MARNNIQPDEKCKHSPLIACIVNYILLIAKLGFVRYILGKHPKIEATQHSKRGVLGIVQNADTTRHANLQVSAAIALNRH